MLDRTASVARAAKVREAAWRAIEGVFMAGLLAGGGMRWREL
jgi:hypothetical protein